ncbi:MAG: efflux RND transporter periplasmic adaptor subunit [Bacteroidales bacterium]|jgi:RND family efflux transporter, MFP subunit|nr:efflux RND transporter periplasmic adaptor subunit [Bacteroidales bacterium]
MEAKKKKKLIIWGIIIAVLIILVVALLALKKGKPHGMMLNTERAKIDSIEVTVTATGEIQPVYKVDVGTQVSGKVEKLYVDFNSEVKKGDLLAELDRSTLSEQVQQAEAQLSNAQSNLTLAQRTYDRTKALFDNKAATQEALDAAEDELIRAKNQLVTAKSNCQKTKVDLGYAMIYSPISGVVLNKAVEEGQTVASSFSTPTLFTIANNLTEMQVEANVDEADIGQVKVGQPVTFTVDAFPEDVFTGTVKQVRLEPTVTSNVVTYTVIIDAPNPEEKLFPGMTASVSIIVKKEVGVSVPMEALYCNIDKTTMEVMMKQGITFKELFASQEELTQSLRDVESKTLWVKRQNTVEQVSVKPGLNDGAKTLITEGIREGDEVVLSVSEMKMPGKPQKDGNNPFMMGPPQRKQR